MHCRVGAEQQQYLDTVVDTVFVCDCTGGKCRLFRGTLRFSLPFEMSDQGWRFKMITGSWDGFPNDASEVH